MEILERIPFTAQKEIFKKVAEIADCRNLDSTDKAKYNASRDAIDDYYSGLVGAWIEGKENGEAAGRAIGLAKGLAEGKAKGLAEGRAEGQNQEKIANAKRFLALGLAPDKVAEGTQLPLEEVLKLV